MSQKQGAKGWMGRKALHRPKDRCNNEEIGELAEEPKTARAGGWDGPG